MPKFLNIGLVAAWIAVAALAAQIYGLGRRIVEIENHQNRTDTAAVSKFERDFFAKLQAYETARNVVLARQQAQRNAAVAQGLKGLPTGDMGKPVLWGNP